MADLRLPQAFGRYVLRERIGRGGMAEVFRASQPGLAGFDKQVAVKRMHRELADDPGFVEMLSDEARIASQLAHPNIAQVLDVGRVGDAYFMALEYVDGIDLFALLQRLHEQGRDLPIGLAVFIVAELCSALDHAHARTDSEGRPLAIVHRDVSPQNVLLGRSGEVKLTDFGIAKAAYRASRTEAGLVKGKVYYMAPEQVRGLATDCRADLFAAGILLFEALTTQPLYDETDPQRLIEKVSHAQWAWPAKAERVPTPLRAVVEQALQPDVGQRFASGRQMRAALLGAAATAGLACDREDLAEFIRGLWGQQAWRSSDAAPRADERWNSRLDVPVAAPVGGGRGPAAPLAGAADDSPTQRDPARREAAAVRQHPPATTAPAIEASAKPVQSTPLPPLPRPARTTAPPPAAVAGPRPTTPRPAPVAPLSAAAAPPVAGSAMPREAVLRGGALPLGVGALAVAPLDPARAAPSDEATQELDHAALLRRLGEDIAPEPPAALGWAMEDTTKPRPPVGIHVPAATQQSLPAVVQAQELLDDDEPDPAAPATMELLVATGVVWVCAVVLAVYATLITVRQ